MVSHGRRLTVLRKFLSGRATKKVISFAASLGQYAGQKQSKISFLYALKHPPDAKKVLCTHGRLQETNPCVYLLDVSGIKDGGPLVNSRCVILIYSR